jgi:hypothetical protein
MTANEPPKPAPAHRRRLRVRLIRRRTAAAALATFALAFGAIAATGSMGATHKKASDAPRYTQAQQTSPSNQGSTPVSPPPVTTRQS